MDIVIVLNAVCGEFQLKDRGPIVVVEFLIVEYRVRRIDVGLGQRNLLRFLQRDVGGRLAVFDISRVIIIVVNGYDTGRKAQPFHCILGAGAHVGKKIVAGKHRTGFQLQDDVLFVAFNVIHEKTGFIDFDDQIPQNIVAAFPDIIRIRFHNAFAVVVPAGQGYNFAIPVVFDLDFRIDTQGKNPRLLQRCSFLHRRSASGQKDCRSDSQGRDRCKKFSSQIHVDYSSRMMFKSAFVSPYTHRLRKRILKTGVSWKIF